MTHGLRIRVRGQVQGVGFRPFVWQLARQFGIAGSVQNDPEGVLIFACGPASDRFVAALEDSAPPLSRIDSVETSPHKFSEAPVSFEIAASTGSGAETRVTPDAATCADCLADIEGQDQRRHGYAFTNCTHCGPRFTILRELPYDRSKTTMAPFEMCPECAREYADPGDRRFHAQPVACAHCGPQLWLEKETERHQDAIVQAAACLLSGQILAIKGLGGFHLCCDATNPDAIAILRALKKRPTKPLALMGSEADISRYALVSELDWDHLRAPAAPIVLLPKTAPLPDDLAPHQGKLGWILPYTPLHHLLLAAVARPLVMTSGNLSGEPQVIGNEEAREKLVGIVDGFLMHDRDIARRLDDSVVQTTAHGPMVLRRARGQVPETLHLPRGFEDAPQVVAFGAHLKSAICLIKNGQALLSHHLGDLDDALTWDEFVKADADYTNLFDHKPAVFACDLHPGYRSSQHAAARADGAPTEVQHHHAHLAACLAENDWPRSEGPVAGIILDGLGLGSDGTIWGGEILVGDYAGFERRAWLDPAPLPGGDAANRAPWRNLLARLDQAGLSTTADHMLADKPRDILRQAMRSGLNAPLSSSAGRVFDAAAALLGLVPDAQSFEGEAAMMLEALAQDVPEHQRTKAYDLGAGGWSGEGALNLNTLWPAMLKDLEEGCSEAIISWRFHAALAQSFASAARTAVQAGAAKAVVLSGGCFQNALLEDLTLRSLPDVRVMRHSKVPANDGGLALGQAVIAAARVLDSR